MRACAPVVPLQFRASAFRCAHAPSPLGLETRDARATLGFRTRGLAGTRARASDFSGIANFRLLFSGPRAAGKNVPRDRDPEPLVFVLFSFCFPYFRVSFSLSFFLPLCLKAVVRVSPHLLPRKALLFSPPPLSFASLGTHGTEVKPPTCVPAPSRVSASRSWARPIPPARSWSPSSTRALPAL